MLTTKYYKLACHFKSTFVFMSKPLLKVPFWLSFLENQASENQTVGCNERKHEVEHCNCDVA